MLNLDIRVLIVDDSATTRKITRKYLSDFGYTKIDEAADGGLAWSRIQGTQPPFGLVICDWHMPRISGLELLKNVRSTADFKSLCFVMATGEQNKDEVVKALKLGTSGYIVKPFEPETLFKTLEKIPGLRISESDLKQQQLEEERLKKAAKSKELDLERQKIAKQLAGMQKSPEEEKKKTGS